MVFSRDTKIMRVVLIVQVVEFVGVHSFTSVGVGNVRASDSNRVFYFTGVICSAFKRVGK